MDCRCASSEAQGCPNFQKTTLQQEGDDDVDAMFISTTSSVENDVTSTTLSLISVLDDDVDAMFFLESRKDGHLRGTKPAEVRRFLTAQKSRTSH